MDNNLASITYAGDFCLCTIQLWSLANNEGETTIINISESNGVTNLTAFWSSEASSFTISC